MVRRFLNGRSGPIIYKTIGYHIFIDWETTFTFVSHQGLRDPSLIVVLVASCPTDKSVSGVSRAPKRRSYSPWLSTLCASRACIIFHLCCAESVAWPSRVPPAHVGKLCARWLVRKWKPVARNGVTPQYSPRWGERKPFDAYLA